MEKRFLRGVVFKANGEYHFRVLFPGESFEEDEELSDGIVFTVEEELSMTDNKDVTRLIKAIKDGAKERGIKSIGSLSLDTD